MGDSCPVLTRKKKEARPAAPPTERQHSTNAPQPTTTSSSTTTPTPRKTTLVVGSKFDNVEEAKDHVDKYNQTNFTSFRVERNNKNIHCTACDFN